MGRRFRYSDLSSCRKTVGVRKRSATIGSREKGWWIEWPPFLLFVRWRPWGGLMPCVLTRIGAGEDAENYEFPDLWSAKMKRLSLNVSPGEALPPLSSESAIFKRFPRFREFMSVRQYDDGTVRKPGRLWMESDHLAFTATIFEQSGFGRMRFRAQSMDDLFAAIEAFLNQDQPQWEDDQFAREKAAQKSPKKKSA